MAAEDELRSRLADATRRGDRRAEAIVRFSLGDLARRRGDLATARAEYQQTTELFRATLATKPATKELSATLNNLGLVCVALNDFEGARRAFEEAIDLCSRAGDFDGVRRALGNFASAASDSGEFDAARMLHEQALEIARTSRDAPGTARALSNLAWTYVRLGSEKAVPTIAEALELSGTIDDPRLLASITHTHALICIRERAYDRALRDAEWCRRTFAYLGDLDWAALAESTAAIAAAAAGRWSGVASSVSNALTAIPPAQLRRGVAQRCVGLASIAAAAGEAATARELCDLAAAIATALGDEALFAAAAAQRSDSPALTTRATTILTACRAMFRPIGSTPELAEVPWLQRRYGERPPIPAPVTEGRTLLVGPLTLLDLTDEGHGWSLFCDLTTVLRTETNYDAEDRIRGIIQRNDPMLAKVLVFDTEADNVSIVTKTREDILGVAAWTLSAIPDSAAGTQRSDG
jgi:hypothetical protein